MIWTHIGVAILLHPLKGCNMHPLYPSQLSPGNSPYKKEERVKTCLTLLGESSTIGTTESAFPFALWGVMKGMTIYTTWGPSLQSTRAWTLAVPCSRVWKGKSSWHCLLSLCSHSGSSTICLWKEWTWRSLNICYCSSKMFIQFPHFIKKRNSVTTTILLCVFSCLYKHIVI